MKTIVRHLISVGPTVTLGIFMDSVHPHPDLFIICFILSIHTLTYCHLQMHYNILVVIGDYNK